jgi:vacuolar-type H+-ATPase subunit F/Vma7
VTLQGEWKRLLWRPHIGQLLVLFSISTILFTSAILFFVIPESKELASRVKILESVVLESLLKNQEAVIAIASRVETSAQKLETEAQNIHNDLKTLVEIAERRNLIREQEHKEIKENLEKALKKSE